MSVVIDAVYTAIGVLQDFGLLVSHLEIDDEIHRVPTKNSKGQKDGWYCFHDIGTHGHIAGAYGEWRDGGQSFKYRSWDGQIMSGDQRAQLDKVVKQKFENAEAKKKSDLEQCIKRCIAQWDNGKVSGEHAYLSRKNIRLLGARLSNDAIIFPLHDIEFNIKGLQKIWDDKKRFETGTSKKGHGFLIGKVRTEGGKVLFCEGYATGATLAEASDLPVVVCVDAGNLEPVIASYRNKYSYETHEFIICADDDRFKDCGNAGIDKANLAAELHSCRVITPIFSSDDTKPTDFNDLHCLEGLSEVKAQILGRVARAELIDSDLDIKYLGDIVTLIESSSSEINRSATIHGALSFISHACSGQVTTSQGDKCNIFIANASHSADSVGYVARGIDSIFYHVIGDNEEDLGAIRTDRLTSVSQFNKHYQLHKTMLYLPDDIGGAVARRNYQSSGATDSVLSKIKTVFNGDTQFSFVGDDGKRVIIADAHINICAGIKESDFYHFAKTSDNGFLTMFITNVVNDADFKTNKSRRKSQITNAIHKPFIEHCTTMLSSGYGYAFKCPATVLDFEYDPVHYKQAFDDVAIHKKEYRQYVTDAYDNFKRLSAILAFWNGDRSIVPRATLESCAKYCIYRLKSVIDELDVKKSDDVTGDVRARVLDAVFKAKEKGITETKLVENTSLYRKLTTDERITVIMSMITDGQIEQRITKGRGGVHGKRFFMK